MESSVADIENAIHPDRLAFLVDNGGGELDSGEIVESDIAENIQTKKSAIEFAEVVTSSLPSDFDGKLQMCSEYVLEGQQIRVSPRSVEPLSVGFGENFRTDTGQAGLLAKEESTHQHPIKQEIQS